MPKNNNKPDKIENNSSVEYVKLPYDFIPFPKKWVPYNKEMDKLPRHDRSGKLNGYIKYKILPESDLAIETRNGTDNTFISGSQMLGRVRMNAEILSQGYPHFINKAPILYRDIAQKQKNKEKKGQINPYIKKLGIVDGIEKSIRVGFLRKEGQEFYVVPAEKISDKNFISIKEHRLKKMGRDNSKGFSWLYKWDNNILDEITDAQKQIDKLTIEIKGLREQLKKELPSIQSEINKIFLKDFAFNKKFRKNNLNAKKFNGELGKLYTELIKKLNNLNQDDLSDLRNLFEKMATRWKLKATIHSLYYKMKNSEKFKPYQKQVFYSENNNGGISEITFGRNKENQLKGYLYNSTNARSKRSHYFIKEAESGVGYAVPQSVIVSYNQNMKKFRYTSKDGHRNEDEARRQKAKYVKNFYDIFEKFDNLEQYYPEGLIVFFKLCGNSEDKNKLEMIGRTPYFKVPYKNSIEEFINNEKGESIGFADALFGFSSDMSKNLGESKNYKSRVRFSAIVMNKEPNFDSRKFLLPTPSASANAMYLKQNGESDLSTYNENAELNGYKYYRVLRNTQQSKEQPEEMISTKKIIKNDKDLYMEGKVYFKNIEPYELGLLLLSLDIKQLLSTQKCEKFVKKNETLIKNSFEQIGGAKPYGYGKVRVDIDSLYIEKNDSSFESLVLDPKQEETNNVKYIDDFISIMRFNLDKNDDYLGAYIKSKNEKEESGMVNWFNINDKLGGSIGYHENWRLFREK